MSIQNDEQLTPHHSDTTSPDVSMAPSMAETAASEQVTQSPSQEGSGCNDRNPDPVVEAQDGTPAPGAEKNLEEGLDKEKLPPSSGPENIPEKSLVEERVSELERQLETMSEQLQQQQQQLETMSEQLQQQRQEIQDKEQEIEKQKDQTMRRTADFDNFKRRNEREQDNVRFQQKRKILSEILPVVDSFERARLTLAPGTREAQSIHDQYQGIYKQLTKTLKQLDVSPMKVVGQLFDPNLHEAVMREPSQNYKEDEVVEELQRGYNLEGQVLRYAMVKVSMGPGPGDQDLGPDFTH